MVRKAFVDREICIGCSVCTETCSGVFTVREDTSHGNDFKSFPDDTVDQEPIADKVQEAIHSCPVQCISWKEKDGAGSEENRK